MEQRSVESLVRALNEADVRYLIVGGLAVAAHGYLRLTADVDLVLDLKRDNLTRAITALMSLGYRPRAPVAFLDFVDPEKRAQWIREKGMTVFSAFSPDHAATELDLFVESPFDFDVCHDRAVRFEVATGLTGSFVGLTDLITMKRRANRPVDRLDIQQLESLHRLPEDDV